MEHKVLMIESSCSNSRWCDRLKNKFDETNKDKVKAIKCQDSTFYPSFAYSTKYLPWFIKQVQQCDVVVINISEMDEFEERELSIVRAVNIISDKNIPIVGFGSSEYEQPGKFEEILCYRSECLDDVVDFVNGNVFI